MKWKRVDDYKQLPEGSWLVELEEPMLGSNLAVARAHPNLTTIGGRFAFEAPRVIGYANLPVPDYSPLDGTDSDSKYKELVVMEKPNDT